MNITERSMYKYKNMQAIEFCVLANEADKNSLSCATIEEYPDKILITNIQVPEKYKGVGIGTVLINEILKKANEKCKTTALFPASYGSQEYQNALIKYYERFGFQINEEEKDVIELIKKVRCH